MTAPLRRAIAVVSAVALLALGACGDDDDDEGGATTSTSAASSTTETTDAPTTTAPEGEPHVVSVYLLRGEELAVGEARTVETDAVLAEALRALLDGPSDFEREIGLTSAIPEGTRLLGVEIVDGVARVDLSAEIGSGGGSLSMQARLAQLVHTATQFDTVDSVRILVDGEEVESIGGEGLMVDEAIGRADLEESGLVPAVLLEQPRPGDEIDSPVRLTGSANVFEAVFQVEVVDGEGLIVAEERVMASSGTGTRGTFDVSVDFEPQRAGLGSIVASIRSPRDGAREVVAEVPVRVG